MKDIDTAGLLDLIEKLESWDEKPVSIYVPENVTLNINGMKVETNDLIYGELFGRKVKSHKDFKKIMDSNKIYILR